MSGDNLHLDGNDRPYKNSPNPLNALSQKMLSEWRDAYERLRAAGCGTDSYQDPATNAGNLSIPSNNEVVAVGTVETQNVQDGLSVR
jgi:hypothetical protein